MGRGWGRFCPQCNHQSNKSRILLTRRTLVAERGVCRSTFFEYTHRTRRWARGRLRKGKKWAQHHHHYTGPLAWNTSGRCRSEFWWIVRDETRWRLARIQCNWKGSRVWGRAKSRCRSWRWQRISSLKRWNSKVLAVWTDVACQRWCWTFEPTGGSRFSVFLIPKRHLQMTVTRILKN